MNNQNVFGWTIVSGVLVFLSCQGSSKPTENFEGHAQNHQLGVLQKQSAIWNKNQPAAYRFRYRNPSSGIRENDWMTPELEITVVDRKPYSVRRMDTQKYHWDPSGFPTIDIVFEKVKSAMVSDKDVEIKYDREFWFPSFVDVGEIEADSGFQIQITEFKKLDASTLTLPNPSEIASQEEAFDGLLQFPTPASTNVIGWLETNRQKRNGVACIWNLNTGTPSLYGGSGDRGNDVQIAIGGSGLVVFKPATRIKFGLDCYSLASGVLNHSAEWSRPYGEFVGGGLSRDGRCYAMIQSPERVPVKSGGFTTNWSSRNGEIRMVDARTGKDLWTKSLEKEIQFGAVCRFSPDNEIFAFSCIPPSGASHKLNDKFVSFHRTENGHNLHRCAGELVAFSPNGKHAIVRRVFADAPSYRLIQLDLDTKQEKQLRTSPYLSFRFAHFANSGELLVDVSAHKCSVHLDIERINTHSGKALGNVILPALNFNEKFSFSPSGKTFARLTRNGTNECRIEIHDVQSGSLRRSLKFASDSRQNKGHVIGDVILIDDDRLATSHPLVIWRD